MSNTNPYLLLWLEAPLQSWGFDSKFGRRDTQAFPTKSGIMGLLCSALGAGGEQRDLLAEFALLNQTAISYVRFSLKDEKKIRQEKEPLLRDFHMVGNGYNDKTPWEKLLIPKTSDGKSAVGGGAKMTYRYYLQDAAFAVVMEVPFNRSQAIIDALQNPVWDTYLGRKNCVPTDFVYRGLFDSETLAIDKASDIALEKNRMEDFRVIQAAKFDDGEVFTLNDVPVQFGEDKRYRDRQVTLIKCI